MSKVIIKPAAYTYQVMRNRFFEIMESVGDEVIAKNDRVLIKPNLLAPAPPEKAILTHPFLVKAAVEYVLDKGGRPQVSDSPAMGTFRRVMKAGGIQQALEGLDVKCKEFTASIRKDIGDPFGAIEIAEDALNVDAVINLPKLKTHSQMLMTLGIKNLFGCVVGMRKPEWHLRMGVEREMFARLLVGIFRSVQPVVTVMDGVLAMEGQGPGSSGTPRHIGVLLGSRDTAALDETVCRMIGTDPQELLTSKVARELGLIEGEVVVEGEFPDVANFQLPETGTLLFGPAFLQSLMRRQFVQRPVCRDDLCESCGECWNYCPASAISRKNNKLTFDYDACIRCYCCVEVCPHGALGASLPLPGKVLKFLTRNRR